MARYAESTTVPADKSRAEIERTLQRYGADMFMYGWETDRAAIMFRAHGRHVRLVLPLPPRADFETYKRGYNTHRRTDAAAEKAWEQATRQRWRALALVIKAKLEAVESGISTFEREFMADTLLSDGRTVSDFMEPQLDAMYKRGISPRPLLELPAGREEQP